MVPNVGLATTLDYRARQFAQKLSALLAWQVSADNRPRANAIVATEKAIRAQLKDARLSI
jgi:hypothetical protein